MTAVLGGQLTLLGSILQQERSGEGQQHLEGKGKGGGGLKLSKYAGHGQWAEGGGLRITGLHA